MHVVEVLYLGVSVHTPFQWWWLEVGHCQNLAMARTGLHLVSTMLDNVGPEEEYSSLTPWEFIISSKCHEKQNKIVYVQEN